MEMQTCPSRMQQAGPWERKELIDRWETDRWLVDLDAVKAKHDAEDARGLSEHNERNAKRGEPLITLETYRTKVSIRGRSNDAWYWNWGPPRTCSFCAGIHPEDALKLMVEGWEVDGTSKNYKRYLNPPGTGTMHDAFLASVRDKTREPGEGVPSVWSPTPPVKIYFWHWAQEQGQRFNAILESRIVK